MLCGWEDNHRYGIALGGSRKEREMSRDQLNSRFHGRDIFHEIGVLP